MIASHMNKNQNKDQNEKTSKKSIASHSKNKFKKRLTITSIKRLAPSILLIFSSIVSLHGVASIESPFEKAQQLLKRSETLEQQSRQTILNANKTRQQINKLRAQSRQAGTDIQKQSLLHKARQMANQLTEAQQQGAHLRTESSVLVAEAKVHFKQGFIHQWSEWVKNSAPLSMNDSVIEFIAHNTQIRSVHPTMLNKMGTPTDTLAQSESPKDMTLLVPALASQKAPPDLDIGAFQISRERHYIAHIEVNEKQNNSSNASSVPLNKIHQWHLMVSDLNGNPATNISIDIEGHMPGHVHGLPTQPRVTEEIAPGIYRVEGVKFQMKGWWVMKFIFETESSASAPDEVTFNLVF